MAKSIIRIHNIELRKSATISKNPVVVNEIVRWQKNNYYGKRKEYEANGWTFDEDGDAHKDNVHISGDFFTKMEETCYVLMWVKWDEHEGYFDLETVGIRPFELDDNDYRDLKKLINMIDCEDVKDDGKPVNEDIS